MEEDNNMDCKMDNNKGWNHQNRSLGYCNNNKEEEEEEDKIRDNMAGMVQRILLQMVDRVDNIKSEKNFPNCLEELLMYFISSLNIPIYLMVSGLSQF